MNTYNTRILDSRGLMEEADDLNTGGAPAASTEVEASPEQQPQKGVDDRLNIGWLGDEILGRTKNRQEEPPKEEESLADKAEKSSDRDAEPAPESKAEPDGDGEQPDKAAKPKRKVKVLKESAKKVEPLSIPEIAPEPTHEEASDDEDVEEDEDEAEAKLLDYVAKRSPKYASLPDSQKKWVAAREEKIKSLMDRDPDATRDDVLNGDDFRDWETAQERKGLKPSLPRGVRRAMNERMIAERVRDEVGKEIREKEIAPIAAEIRKIKEGPEVEATFQKSAVNVWGATVKDAPAPVVELDECIKSAQKEGKDPAKVLIEEYPEEASALSSSIAESHRVIKSFIRISRNLEGPDTANNPDHLKLAEKIKRFNDMMISDPNYVGLRVRDGKTFCPGDVFNRLPKGDRSKYWTFSSAEILNMLEQDAANSARKAVVDARSRAEKVHQNMLKRYGITADELAAIKKRKTIDGKQVPPPPSREPAKNPPKGRPASSPGVSIPAKAGQYSTLAKDILGIR